MSRRVASQAVEEEELSLRERLLGFLRMLSPILAAAGTIAMVGGIGLFLWSKDLRTFAQPVILVGVALLLMAALASVETVIATVTGRRGRYSANTLAMVAFFLAVLGLAYFILYQREFRYDTTATRQFTLSDHTVQVLEQLDQPVEAIGFFVPTEELLRRQAEDLLYEYGRRSPNFTFRFVDPERDPSTARWYGITSFSTIVFEAPDAGKQRILYTPPVTEQDLTSALLIVTGQERKKVYFLTGHGERSIAEVMEAGGLGLAAQGVAADNYQVEPLSLVEEGAQAKLQQAAVVVIAGPQTGFLSFPVSEQELLEEYLKKGGNALFLVDINIPRAWRQLLAKWGVAVVPGEAPDEEDLAKIKDPLERALALVDGNPGYVVDQGSSVTGDPRTPILQRSQYERAESLVPSRFPRENPVSVTRDLDVTFYPGAVALNAALPPKDLPQTIRVIRLAQTTDRSWLTPDPEDNAQDPERDTPGPHGLALAVEAVAPLGEETNPGSSGVVGAENPTRLAVFGDADFATNKYFYAYSNADFILNAINWLAEDYNLISIRPKPVVFRELVTTRQEFDFIRYSSLFLLPAAVLLLGAVVWWRRQ